MSQKQDRQTTCAAQGTDSLGRPEVVLPGWRPIETAPKDGTHFFAIVDDERRIVSWGKTSHVPMYGFCLSDQGPEDFDLCDPVLWYPFPPLPSEGSHLAAQTGRDPSAPLQLRDDQSNPELVEALRGVTSVLREVVETLAKEAPGTDLNNRRFTGLGIHAWRTIEDAERRLATLSNAERSGSKGGEG